MCMAVIHLPTYRARTTILSLKSLQDIFYHERNQVYLCRLLTRFTRCGMDTNIQRTPLLPKKRNHPQYAAVKQLKHQF